jgi:hypothetical protein
LFSKFKTKSKKIFLDKFSKVKIDNQEKYSIILSPSLYWVKKLNLSLNSRDIKKLLPSIFEDILPEGNYSYYVYKDGDEYIAFAYEDKNILNLLKEKNIPLANISSIHFAQTELKNLSEPVKVNENEALYVKDNIVLISPKDWFQNLRYLNLDDITLSNKKIKIKQYSDLISPKHLYKINIALGLFIFILIAQLVILDKKIDKIEIKKDKLSQKYNLKPTMMQNVAILNSYKEVFKKQLKLRKTVEKFLKLKLNKNEKIMNIKYDGKKVLLKIKGISNEKQAKNVIKVLKKENFIFSHKFIKNQMQIEVEI